MQLDDPKCVRCTLGNVECDTGQQKKVGRPKRKTPAVPSAPTNPPASKRKKSSANSRVQVTHANEPLLVQQVPDFSGTYGVPTQIYMEADGGSKHFLGTQSALSAPIPIMPDLGLQDWPSGMGVSWWDSVLPPAPSDRILTGTISDSSHNANAAYLTEALWMEPSLRSTYPSTLVLPDFRDQVLSHDLLSWISPAFWITPDLTPKYSLTKKRNHPLPFGIGRPPAYYIHANQFSSSPADVPLSDFEIDGSGAMVKFVSIIRGLQLRSIMVQSNRERIDLSLLIQREGPLFIDNYSLVEYVMESTEQLVQIAASLLNLTHRPDERLSVCLITTVVDVYCRVLSFFGLFLEPLTDRAERIATDPVIPIPDLKFDGVVLTEPGTQGTLICSSIFYLLGRVEIVLGLGSTWADKGLLSTNQIEMLYRKVDRSDDLIQTRGIMRPSDVKKLYMQVATLLEQLSSMEHHNV
jgi:hypothetical protein